jgi:hypothetical protein
MKPSGNASDPTQSRKLSIVTNLQEMAKLAFIAPIIEATKAIIAVTNRYFHCIFCVSLARKTNNRRIAPVERVLIRFTQLRDISGNLKSLFLSLIKRCSYPRFS